MNIDYLKVLVLFSSIVVFASCQSTVVPQIEQVLDSWSSRENALDALSKVTGEPLPVLIAVAKSNEEPYLRRQRAISLLAIIESPLAEQALTQVASDPDPRFRCLALQAIADLNSDVAVKVLVSKLDDRAVCMQLVSSHQELKQEVYVSDEAIRLLEQLTGQSFGNAEGTNHRATEPWKEWWAGENMSGKPN